MAMSIYEQEQGCGLIIVTLDIQDGHATQLNTGLFQMTCR